MRVGLVGAGVISHNHLPNLQRLGAQVRVYSEAGAPELVTAHGGTVSASTVAASLDELLDWAEVIDLASPTFTHYPLARQALLAGRDVICEKPLARTDEQAAELVLLAEQTGRRLYPSHVVRYFPAYARLHGAVRDQRLGDLAVLRFYRSGGFPVRSAWFADLALSGGVVLDMMIHDLDIARWLAGEVTQVSATWTRKDGPQPAEAAHVLLTHASGAITQVSGLWGAAHLRFTTGYFAAGTGGTLEYDRAAEPGFTADLERGPARGEAVPETDPAEDPYFLVLEDFLGAIQHGTPTRVTAADGAAAVRIANAALSSAQDGRPVTLETP
jgi:myo-inositol 2-dehydrogenase/D-chiro-inositol 1-dehydrogenase